VTLLRFPCEVSDIVFRLSFLSFFVIRKLEGFCGGGDGRSSDVLSVDVLARLGSFIRDFFFTGSVPFTSIVGAVVMISGAITMLSARLPSGAGLGSTYAVVWEELALQMTGDELRVTVSSHGVD